VSTQGDDDGRADPALAEALAAWAAQPSPRTAALVYAAIVDARLLVPVVATLVESETAAATGLPAEKTSEMSVVTLVAPSGATALPAFASTEAMRRWRLDVRPVPALGREVCRAALDGGHRAVVVEPIGAHFLLTGGAMQSLAEGYVPVATPGGPERLASRQVDDELRLTAPASPPGPELRRALREALTAEPGIVEAYLLDAVVGSAEPSPVLGLVLRPGVPREEIPALASRLAAGGGLGRFDVAVLGPRQQETARAVGLEVLPGG
jgi:hypothetical protein